MYGNAQECQWNVRARKANFYGRVTQIKNWGSKSNPTEKSCSQALLDLLKIAVSNT